MIKIVTMTAYDPKLLYSTIHVEAFHSNYGPRELKLSENMVQALSEQELKELIAYLFGEIYDDPDVEQEALDSMNGITYATGGYVENSNFKIGSGDYYFTPSQDDPSVLATNLPGVSATVKHPISGSEVTLRDAIINLNDRHKWSRERIADWLDEISDPTGETGPDLRFKAEPTEKDFQDPIKKNANEVAAGLSVPPPFPGKITVGPETQKDPVLSDEWNTLGYTNSSIDFKFKCDEPNEKLMKTLFGADWKAKDEQD